MWRGISFRPSANNAVCCFSQSIEIWDLGRADLTLQLKYVHFQWLTGSFNHYGYRIRSNHKTTRLRLDGSTRRSWKPRARRIRYLLLVKSTLARARSELASTWLTPTVSRFQRWLAAALCQHQGAETPSIQVAWSICYTKSRATSSRSKRVDREETSRCRLPQSTMHTPLTAARPAMTVTRVSTTTVLTWRTPDRFVIIISGSIIIINMYLYLIT